jgi:elongation factor 1-gamma
MLLGSVTYSKPWDTSIREGLARPLGVIEKHLSTRTYYVGERITLADLTAAGVFVVAYETLVDKKARDAHPHTLRHYNTIRNHPLLKDIWGSTEFVETAKVYTPPAKAPKEEKPKAQAAPKAAPKEKAPKPKKDDDDDDEEEPLVPAEPKQKNPLDDLPKSNFNLEDWKRAYSNMDTRGDSGSLKWFYDQ